VLRKNKNIVRQKLIQNRVLVAHTHIIKGKKKKLHTKVKQI